MKNFEIESVMDKKIYIYGAGYKGRICERFCTNQKCEIAGFVISDDQNKNEETVNGRDVWKISQLEIDNKCCILIALDEKYWKDIKKILDTNFGIEISNKLYFVSSEEILYMKRQNEVISSDTFLKQSSPAAFLMGCDRGTSISRYYIKKYLDATCHCQDLIINTYEVGEDRYCKFYYPEANHLVCDYSKGNDLTDCSTLPDGIIDVFICTQVFNVIYDVKKAIKGAYHTLKSGGIMFATVMGNISQVSRSDMRNYGDYWRFTDLSIRMLVEEVFGKGNVTVTAFGNAMATTAYIQGMCVEDLPYPELLDDIDNEFALVIGITARKM